MGAWGDETEGERPQGNGGAGGQEGERKGDDLFSNRYCRKVESRRDLVYDTMTAQHDHKYHMLRLTRGPRPAVQPAEEPRS